MLRVLIVLLMALSLAGCEVVGDIFKAGVWTGVLLIAIVVAIVGFAFAKLRS